MNSANSIEPDGAMSAGNKKLQHECLEPLQLIVGGMVHKMNGVLMPILGVSDILVEHPELMDDKDDLRENLVLIRDSAQSVAEILQCVSELFFPSETSETVTVDVGGLVENAVSLAGPVISEREANGASINILTSLDGVSAFETKENELTEVLKDLVLNAIDAILQEGEINIRVRRNGDDVVIDVEDNGQGMDAQALSRCREPFFCTKGKPHFGLGLTSADLAVQRLNGALEIESGPGNGTRVSVTLPLTAAPGE